MKIALAQINTTVGDFTGNSELILENYKRGVDSGAALVVFPELTIPGYPPRDLLLHSGFIDENLRILQELQAHVGSVGMIVGFIEKNESGVGRPSRNSAALIQHGKILAVRSKSLLPTYDVFDEDRYFEPATDNAPIKFNDCLIGITICEDIWNESVPEKQRKYHHDPAAEFEETDIALLVNISASPWFLGKNQVRESLLQYQARRIDCPVVYCNLVGANDELIFDGGSRVVAAQSGVVAESPLFAPDLLVVDVKQALPVEIQATPNGHREKLVYDALVLGVQDYFRKCGFQSALIALSGGIDSALTACIAVDALGSDRVRGFSLPSGFSSQGSMDDARALADQLGIEYQTIEIEPLFQLAKNQLEPVFKGLAEDVAEENLQARIRGLLMMALSNKFGSLLLTTGNKSELAVGYCTLYGDMCGGLAVISDVPKMMVYRISEWLLLSRNLIPESTITKPPSAELRPNQTDQDSLPPYEILDAILDAFIVERKSTGEIIESGFDPGAVQRVVRLVVNNEYKRRQAAPGLKVTTKAFGIGRRIPVAHKYRHEG
ncbi:MAG TPA: NAD+ synthase [Verrucomicrobiales bacterium]|nr:NAD+ synthase [Verrucomicrobiales bacterium]HIL70848.1 NAD+ synthase [Verrucomicrobiota bacterium]